MTINFNMAIIKKNSLFFVTCMVINNLIDMSNEKNWPKVRLLIFGYILSNLWLFTVDFMTHNAGNSFSINKKLECSFSNNHLLNLKYKV